MQTCELSFNLSQDTSSKRVRFENIELKNEYCSAESQDSRCYNAYKEFKAAWGKKEREEAAKNVDATRYAFYEKWARERGIIKEGPKPIKPGAA